MVWDKNKQCFRVFIHLALPFGAVAAVWYYTRISEGVCYILRRLFAISQQAYVDDFLQCVPKKYAAICKDAFQRVHIMLGIPLKEGKDKVAAIVEVLGHEVVSTTDVVATRPTVQRRQSLKEDVRDLDVSQIGRGLNPKQLAGKLGFISQAFAGRCGRAYLRDVIDAGPVPGPQTLARKQQKTQQLQNAFKWCEALLDLPACNARKPNKR